MQCPKCKTEPLSSTTIQEIDVDRCETCGGVWFDDAELVPLLHTERNFLSALRGGSDKDGRNTQHGNCPRDTTALLRVYSARNRSVVLDACPQCHGVWLDGGEFEALLVSR